MWKFIAGWAAQCCVVGLLSAAGQDFFPVKDVRPGLRGIGKTVFLGERIEEFQVEILGVLQNFGPRQPIILARLSGGPLAETGILQGMSGSPVYIGGKLLGAVALGFPFSKEPIAGIQPIEAIIQDAVFQPDAVFQRDAVLQRDAGLQSPARASAGIERQSRPPDVLSFTNRFDSLLQNTSSTSPNWPSPWGQLSDVRTPLSLSGFTAATITQFDAALHRFGLTTSQGVAAAHPGSLSVSSDKRISVNNLQPGAMISVGLITGDLNMTADGTVTYIDGDKVYAFGHRFLNIGATQMPFARSQVIACIPSTNTSFKLSSPVEWIGTLLSDHSTGIAGQLNRKTDTVPLDVNVNGTHAYHLELVRDRLLTPFLTQSALFSTIDATQRTIGVGTLKLHGQVHFEGNLPPLEVHDLFVSDSGLAQQASADAVVTLAFVLGGGFQDVHIKDMQFQLDQWDTKKQLRLSQAWTSAHDVHPGDNISITAILQAENGAEVVKAIPYQIPAGAPAGPLNLTLSDANTLNFPEFAGIAQTQFRTAAEMLAAVNRYRGSESLYVRVWRPSPAFNIAGPMPGGELTDPPPSIALILADTSSSVSGGATSPARGSDVAQLVLPVSGYVVTGAKTIQIEVKE